MLPVLGGVVWSKESDKRFNKCPSCHVKEWNSHPTCRTLLNEKSDDGFLSVRWVHFATVVDQKMLNCGSQGLEIMQACRVLESAPVDLHVRTKEIAILDIRLTTENVLCNSFVQQKKNLNKPHEKKKGNRV